MKQESSHKSPKKCQYPLDILGVSESIWIGAGKMKTATGEIVHYSGRDDTQHLEGVAIILKKGMEISLMEWRPEKNRLMKARKRGKYTNITII